MKLLLILLLATGCSVKSAIKDQVELKDECLMLKPELDALGSKKLPSVVQAKVKDCEDHGFYPKDKVKLYRPEIEGDL